MQLNTQLSDKLQYTSVKCYGNSVWYRGYNKKTRERVQKKIPYSPTLFMEVNEETGYPLITNKKQQMLPVNFDSIKDAKDHLYQKRDVYGAPSLAGMRNFEYSYLVDTVKDPNIDYSLIKIANIDIEVISDNAESEFPEPDLAEVPIVSITVKTNNKYIVFGLKDFVTPSTDVLYLKCRNESELLGKFLVFWQKYDPDILTGWNINSFDIPYLVNRIKFTLGEDFAKKLSPWGYLRKITKRDKFKTYSSYELTGIEVLDYMHLYQKIPHENQTQESYSLNHICLTELKEGKLDYDEHRSLYELYNEDPQKFYTYNVKDVELVDRLNKKLEFISLYVYTAYDALVNFSDVNSQTVMVDVIAYRHARKKKQVIPAKKENTKEERFAGAYVAPTLSGKYKWVITCDLTSLYPHLQMQFNISPDTLIPKLFEKKLNIDSIVVDTIDFTLQKKAISNNACIAGNGQFFTNDFVGLFPEIQKEMFADRKAYKKKMLECENKLAKLKESDPGYNKLETEVIKYRNLQLAKKLQLNSIYGASGNEYFRYYDLRIAEAITLSGQLVIKRIAYKLNKFFLEKTNKDINFVIGSDTDSVHLNLGPLIDLHFTKKEQETDVQKIVDFIDNFSKTEIEPFIDDCYNTLAQEMNCVENKMHMKREKIAESGIYTKKKKYALLIWDEEGVRYSEAKLKIKGLETQKSNVPKVAREKLKEGLMICLCKDQKDIQKFIEDFKRDVIINRKYTVEQLAAAQTANNVDTYSVALNQSFKKGTPAHVKGAIVYNNLIDKLKIGNKVKKITSGDKVKMIKLIEPNKYNSKAFSFAESIPKQFKFDPELVNYREQFEFMFGKAMRTIVETCGWSDVKKKSLI